MDDFPGILARDFGFRPQGKAAPMAASKGSGIGGAAVSGIGSGAPGWSSSKTRPAWSSTPAARPGAPLLDGHDGIFSSQSGAAFDDVFGGPPRYANPPEGRNAAASTTAFDYDSLFQGSKDSKDPRKSSLPVFDKPLYDDDIFEGVPGIKSSSSVKYEDAFVSMSSPPKKSSPSYDDLLGDLASGGSVQRGSNGAKKQEPDVSGFDDLIPGFGGSQKREASGTNKPHQSTIPSRSSTSAVLDDPFVVLESTSSPVYSASGTSTDPLDYVSKPSHSSNTKSNTTSMGGILNDIETSDGFSINMKEKSAVGGRSNSISSPTADEAFDTHSTRNSFRDSNQTLFDMPTVSSDSKPSKRSGSQASSEVNHNFSDINFNAGMSPKSDSVFETTDDVWLTVDEIPLFTNPTSAPPPARLPPRPPISKGGMRSQKEGTPDSVKNPPVSSMDELEDFAMGRPTRVHADEEPDILLGEELEANSAAAASAAAMKEAMDRAEAKFRHAKEVREREKDAKVAKSRESSPSDVDERAAQEALERVNREKQEKFEQEREQRAREEEEREQRAREEKEREQRKLQKEREERERARQAVEMATREARERAATEARVRAERAAVEKAASEARVRAERAAVQRAAAEARERAASEARERAEKAAAEARERAERETRERAEKEAKEKAERETREKQARERAAVERAAAEVRLRAERAAVERAQAEARERAAAAAAAAAKEKVQKNEDDLESFFGMGARPNSAPKQRTSTSNPFETQFQSKGSDAGGRTSVSTASNMRKASSTANIVDDLSSIFGAAPTSEVFQEVEGESEERRRARFDRHQRTLERAKKALAEKNERDIQTQREQAERHRIAETLDIEIKRWAAGKEGNLRALLSTLQYVLWPECGWQPVSLSDLMLGASVKKVYRKATLCIHPDKVQQKGANLQQKYIAEKVFDILKEAWNKFNSEELF